MYGRDSQENQQPRKYKFREFMGRKEYMQRERAYILVA